MFSSADDSSIALMTAGDRRHLSVAITPIVLTQAGHVRAGPLGSTAIGKTLFFRHQTFDPLLASR